MMMMIMIVVVVVDDDDDYDDDDNNDYDDDDDDDDDAGGVDDDDSYLVGCGSFGDCNDMEWANLFHHKAAVRVELLIELSSNTVDRC